MELRWPALDLLDSMPPRSAGVVARHDATGDVGRATRGDRPRPGAPSSTRSSTGRRRALRSRCPTGRSACGCPASTSGCGTASSAGRSASGGSRARPTCHRTCSVTSATASSRGSAAGATPPRRCGSSCPMPRPRVWTFVELTTDPDNIGSQRVIEANGGVILDGYEPAPGVRRVLQTSLPHHARTDGVDHAGRDHRMGRPCRG